MIMVCHCFVIESFCDHGMPLFHDRIFLFEERPRGRDSSVGVVIRTAVGSGFDFCKFKIFVSRSPARSGAHRLCQETSSRS